MWQTELNPWYTVCNDQWINAKLYKYLARPLNPMFLHHYKNKLLLYSLIYIHISSICNIHFNIMLTAMFRITKHASTTALYLDIKLTSQGFQLLYEDL
jgi:hypothetical protein